MACYAVCILFLNYCGTGQNDPPEIATHLPHPNFKLTGFSALYEYLPLLKRRIK